jgi:hypothetical protein
MLLACFGLDCFDDFFESFELIYSSQVDILFRAKDGSVPRLIFMIFFFVLPLSIHPERFFPVFVVFSIVLLLSK